MFRSLTLIVAVLSGLALPADAEDLGSKAEAMDMVQRVQEAYKLEGRDATFRAITEQDPRFKNKDLYPFVYDFNGMSVAHGANAKMVGKLWINTKDQDGNLLI